MYEDEYIWNKESNFLIQYCCARYEHVWIGLQCKVRTQYNGIVKGEGTKSFPKSHAI
jgi:hypothetical protein